MRPVNPLLVVLADAEEHGCPPEEALVRLMLVLLGSEDDPRAVGLACLWGERNGVPTYGKLRAWARRFAADPENAEIMLPLLASHALVISKMDEADAAAWESNLAAGRE